MPQTLDLPIETLSANEKQSHKDTPLSFTTLSESDIGKAFEETMRKIPHSAPTPPILKKNISVFEAEAQIVATWLEENRIVKAIDGKTIRLNIPEKESILNRAKHLIGRELESGKRVLDDNKLCWVKNILETLRTAQARFKSPNGEKFYYVKNYQGILHIVLVKKRGNEAYLITHFTKPQKQLRAFLQGAILDTIYNGMANLTSDEFNPSQDHTENRQEKTSPFSNRKSFSFSPDESQGGRAK